MCRLVTSIGICLWLAGATAAHASPRVRTILAGTTYAGLATWDAALTVKCVQAKTCHEANPLLAPLVNRHGIKTAMTAKLALNTAMTGGAIYVARKYPHRRKTITAMLMSMAAVQGYVVYRNYQVIQGR